jgi:hypothetical protein
VGVAPEDPVIVIEHVIHAKYILPRVLQIHRAESKVINAAVRQWPNRQQGLRLRA